MLKKSKKPHGFTIVELLIVIVIIAILAAITIVAFNGITSRANAAQTISAVGAYAKALQRYAIDNGSYPISSSACLGSGASCSNVTAPGSAVCFGLGSVSGTNAASVALRSTLQTYFGSNFPNPSTASYACGAGNYSGAFYYSPDGIAAFLYSFFKLGSSCTNINGMQFYSSTSGDTQLCRYSLPSL